MWSKLLCIFLCLWGTAVSGAESIDAVERAFANEQYQEVVILADSLLETATLHLPRLHQLRADSYYYLGDLEKSLESYFQAIHAGEQAEVRDEMLLTECYSHAGFCYREMGLYQQAFPHYERSLQIAKGMHSFQEIAEQYYNLGTLYKHIGDYENSIKLLDSAYQIDVARQDEVAIGFDLSLLSELKAQTGAYDEALFYAKESLTRLQPGEGNANSLANRTKLVGNMFLELDQLDSAGFYLAEAADEYERVGDQWRLASCWLDQAELSIRTGQLDIAANYAQQAHSFFLRNDHSEYFILASNVMAKVYGEMQMIPKALEILEENEAKCQDLGLIKSLRQNYLLQSELLEKAGEIDKAVEMKKKYQVLNDSIQKLDNNEQLNRIALQVKFDKLEKENQILTQRYVAKSADLESTTFKLNGVAMGSILTLAILGIVIYLVRKKMKNKYVQLEQEVETLRHQIKLLLEGDASGVEVDLDKINGCLTTPLTDREFEILGHAISNLSNAQIAEQVFVSVNTVKYHLKNIYDKLGVSNRKQALEYIVQTK